MDESIPQGAIYIAPKAIVEKPIQKWPRFVWCNSPYRTGVAIPQIWYHRCTTGQWANGRPEDKPTLAEHELLPFEAELGIKLLTEIYPLPDGFRI